MFSERNYISVIFLSCLFCISSANADWEPGDDTTVAGFSWDDVSAAADHPFVDASDGKVKYCTSKVVHATNNLDSSHVRTQIGTKIPHNHYDCDYGGPGMATVAEAREFWDYRFQSPDICDYAGSPSVYINCFAWAFNEAFDGVYNYWILSSGIDDILEADAWEITPKSNVATGDVLMYGTAHATFVYAVSGGYPYVKIWKYGSSGLYAIMDSYNFDTPMNCGGIQKNKILAEQPWSWSWSGAGSDGDVYREY